MVKQKFSCQFKFEDEPNSGGFLILEMVESGPEIEDEFIEVTAKFSSTFKMGVNLAGVFYFEKSDLEEFLTRLKVAAEGDSQSCDFLTSTNCGLSLELHPRNRVKIIWGCFEVCDAEEMFALATYSRPLKILELNYQGIPFG